MERRPLWFSVLLTSLLIGSCLALASLSLYIAYTNDGHECLTNYDALRVHYIDWLKAYGFTHVAYMAANLVLLLVFKFRRALIFGLLAFVLFQLVWYVFGGVLFLNEVLPRCRPSSLYDCSLIMYWLGLGVLAAQWAFYVQLQCNT